MSKWRNGATLITILSIILPIVTTVCVIKYQEHKARQQTPQLGATMVSSRQHLPPNFIMLHEYFFSLKHRDYGQGDKRYLSEFEADIARQIYNEKSEEDSELGDFYVSPDIVGIILEKLESRGVYRSSQTLDINHKTIRIKNTSNIEAKSARLDIGLSGWATISTNNRRKNIQFKGQIPLGTIEGDSDDLTIHIWANFLIHSDDIKLRYDGGVIRVNEHKYEIDDPILDFDSFMAGIGLALLLLILISLVWGKEATPNSSEDPNEQHPSDDPKKDESTS
ncbi:MAG: hypothetical protein OIF51_01085 [Cellvibrionaceae bacterium]|nr:hypothetical protein [Cellvibrionaceae bacterium]